MVGSAIGAAASGAAQDASASDDPIRPWVYVLVYSAFAVQGIALAVAFVAHVRARWGPLLRIRTGEAVGAGQVRGFSWPGRYFPQAVVIAAWLALSTAIVCAFWSGAGAFALAGTDAEPSVPMQVARATGAAVAALGLFGLAGRWSTQIRFWLPAALVWIGSGALVAFDALSFLLNGLFALAGTDAMADASWGLTDTFLVAKVLAGVLAAAVGVVAVESGAAAYDGGPDRDSHLTRPPHRDASR